MTRADPLLNDPVVARLVHKAPLADQPGSAAVFKLMFNLDPKGRKFEPGQDVGFVVPGMDPEEGNVRFYTIEEVGEVPFESSIDITLYVADNPHPGSASAAAALLALEPGVSVDLFGPFPYPFYPPMGSRSNVVLIGAGGGLVPFRWLARKIHARRYDWMGKVLMLEGPETGLEHVYANEPGVDQDQYFDSAGYRAFEALKTRYSAVPLDRSESTANNLEALWRLMGQGSVYVYLAGYRSVADAMDKAMTEHLRLHGRWSDAKAALQQNGHWQEWLYD